MLSPLTSLGVQLDRGAEPLDLHKLNLNTVSLSSGLEDVESISTPDSLESSTEGASTHSFTTSTSTGLEDLNLSSQRREANDETSAVSPEAKNRSSSRRSFIRPSPPVNGLKETGPYPATLPSTCEPWHSDQWSPYVPGARRKSFIFGEYSNATINRTDEMRSTFGTFDNYYLSDSFVLGSHIISRYIRQVLSIKNKKWHYHMSTFLELRCGEKETACDLSAPQAHVILLSP